MESWSGVKFGGDIGVEFGGDFGVEFGVCFSGGFLESMDCSTK